MPWLRIEPTIFRGGSERWFRAGFDLQPFQVGGKDKMDKNSCALPDGAGIVPSTLNEGMQGQDSTHNPLRLEKEWGHIQNSQSCFSYKWQFSKMHRFVTMIRFRIVVRLPLPSSLLLHSQYP